MAYCRWLSRRTGMRFTLPTEAQWEWACRAGTATPFWYGDGDTDYGSVANFAEPRASNNGATPCLVDGTIVPATVGDGRFKDGSAVTWPVSRRMSPKAPAHPWGLHDMHGNVAEWTLSAYRPYPHRAGDGREKTDGEARRVARGGSFTDVPRWGRSSHRVHYHPWQRVHNVGFRVVVNTAGARAEHRTAGEH
jgi:formylglycine-generating enzyme required for sulfatase activity